jgi:hypothetical protein
MKPIKRNGCPCPWNWTVRLMNILDCQYTNPDAADDLDK